MSAVTRTAPTANLKSHQLNYQMEIRYVDANHGFAAFAPTVPKSAPVGDDTYAFKSGDSIETEEPIVAWQQAISRWSMRIPAHCEKGNSELGTEGNSCSLDDEADYVPGGGIFACCALCLNSLLSVDQELDRIGMMIVGSKKKTPSQSSRSIREAAAKSLLCSGVFIDQDGKPTHPENDEEIDWSQWFMTAVPKASSLLDIEANSATHDAKEGSEGDRKEWVVVLRKVCTQPQLVLFGHDDPSASPTAAAACEVGGWRLLFCDEACYTKHLKVFGSSRWMLADIATTTAMNANSCRQDNNLKPLPSVTKLLTQYLLFDLDIVESLLASAVPESNTQVDADSDKVAHIDSKVTTLASNPIVGLARSRIWHLVEVFISGGDDDLTNPHQKDRKTDPFAAHCQLHRCLGVIHSLADTFNERYKLILMLICRAMQEISVTVDGQDNSSFLASVRRPEHERLSTVLGRLDMYLQDDFCAKYEEGPYRSLTWRQRESMRVFTTLVNKWLNLLLSHHRGDSIISDQGTRHISLQTIQMVTMVLDANTHSCVVLSPWYVLASAELDSENSTRNSNATKAIHETLNENEVTGPLTSLVFHLSTPTIFNNMGVALYNRCTKINHSCRPNVQFVPTFAPARAHVIARFPLNRELQKGSDGVPPTEGQRAGIKWGEELRTSYLDIDEEYSEGLAGISSLDARRKKLREGYGFLCDCKRCCEELQAQQHR